MHLVYYNIVYIYFLFMSLSFPLSVTRPPCRARFSMESLFGLDKRRNWIISYSVLMVQNTSTVAHFSSFFFVVVVAFFCRWWLYFGLFIMARQYEYRSTYTKRLASGERGGVFHLTKRPPEKVPSHPKKKKNQRTTINSMSNS